MWTGINTINQGSGIPSVAVALRKRGLIDVTNKLTKAGRELALKGYQ
jgi:hypothetical protein